MNLQGEFEGSFLTSILQLLCYEQNSGILLVTCGRKECKVIFQEGTIVYAQSSQKKARLGAMLRRDGIISIGQLRDAVNARRDSRDAIGKILLDRGYISLEVLKKYNCKQVEEILYSILFWKKGNFIYKATSVKFDGKVITHLNPMKLILEASRRIDEMSLLTGTITNDLLVYKKTADKGKNPDELNFSHTEAHILNLIDGTRSVRDIIAAGNYDEFTVYKTIFSLISSGLIEKAEDKNSELDTTVVNLILSTYIDILKIITRILSERSGERVSLLLRKAKESLSREQAGILEDFHLSSAAAVNRRGVASACRKSGGDKKKQSFLLIDSFSGLSHLLLSRNISRTNKNEIYGIIQEIDKSLEHVQRYPKNLMEKDKIINDMKNVLHDVIKQVNLMPEKTKSTGLLSLFNKKFNREEK